VLPSSVVSLTLQRESNILAVICDDLIVRLFDLETKRLVRELTGFKGRVLDMVCTLFDYFIDQSSHCAQAFSHDSRWLVTTSLDSIIRTFDIPTGQVIDAFRTSNVATSLSFSPTGDFLASAHVGSLGIYLW
jgi:U3 small nucleolar RNA-associated protein 21